MSIDELVNLETEQNGLAFGGRRASIDSLCTAWPGSDDDLPPVPNNLETGGDAVSLSINSGGGHVSNQGLRDSGADLTDLLDDLDPVDQPRS